MHFHNQKTSRTYWAASTDWPSFCGGVQLSGGPVGPETTIPSSTKMCKNLEATRKRIIDATAPYQQVLLSGAIGDILFRNKSSSMFRGFAKVLKITSSDGTKQYFMSKTIQQDGAADVMARCSYTGPRFSEVDAPAAFKALGVETLQLLRNRLAQEPADSAGLPCLSGTTVNVNTPAVELRVSGYISTDRPRANTSTFGTRVVQGHNGKFGTAIMQYTKLNTVAVEKVNYTSWMDARAWQLPLDYLMGNVGEDSSFKSTATTVRQRCAIAPDLPQGAAVEALGTNPENIVYTLIDNGNNVHVPGKYTGAFIMRLLWEQEKRGVNVIDTAAGPLYFYVPTWVSRNHRYGVTKPIIFAFVSATPFTAEVIVNNPALVKGTRNTPRSVNFRNFINRLSPEDRQKVESAYPHLSTWATRPSGTSEFNALSKIWTVLLS